MPYSPLLQEPRAMIRELTILPGSFVPNGTGTPSATTAKGKGVTITRTATGTFKLAFDRTWGEIPCVVATLQRTTAIDGYVQVGAVTTTSAIVRMRISTTGIAIAADATTGSLIRINFCVFGRNSGIGT